ncbi:L-rhamnonate dehydratase-like [Ruditapes philippinarum]|uniref:L-rhamnonate dehydratase-like n=1 Tax=Ruditapes philippinarum TaxID=129788 RepID=UPI00295BF24A|nr:L-rhamnonate dehydratase-like [Ruditapes philippinarum]
MVQNCLAEMMCTRPDSYVDRAMLQYSEDPGVRVHIKAQEGDQGADCHDVSDEHWINCYIALTVLYATRLANELEPYGLKWMEEFLPPDVYEGYAQVGGNLRGSKVLLTTGEHEYNRYGFDRLIHSRCVDILQPDITWLGGITEARRVVSMAAAHDTMIKPRDSSVYSYHLQYALPTAQWPNIST